MAGATVLRQEWQGHVQALEASGQGVEDFCRERDLSVIRLKLWRTKLRREASESEAGFVEMRVGAAEAGCAVVVRLRNGLGVEVGQGFDAKTLRLVIEALRC